MFDNTQKNKTGRVEHGKRFLDVCMDDMDEIFLDLTATSLQWWLGLGVTIPIFLGLCI